MQRKMKDSGIPWIGMIPEDWEVCRFKDTHNGTNVGESIDKQYWSDDINLIPFYSASATPLRTNYKDFPECKFTTHEDLLLSRNGTPYVYLPVENAAYTDHIIRVTIKNLFDKLYVKYCIEQAIQSVSVNTVSLATWSASIWNEQKLPIPPLAEQEAIASWLDEKCGEIDELIDVGQKMIDKLEAYRQATITETVTHGLNPDVPMRQTNISWIPEIPEHWSDSRLKHLTSLITDGTHITPNYIEHGVPFLSIKDISSRRIDFTDTKFISEKEHEVLSQHAPVKRGDILFARIGTLGIFVKVDTDIIFDIFVSLGLIKPKTDRIYTDFLVYYLSSSVVLNYINSVKAGGGTSAAKFNLGDVAKTYVIVPPITEQIAIADYLDTKCKEIDDLIVVKREKIETLKQYRQSIIFEAVTGKLQIS